MDILKIVASILHLGNVKVHERDQMSNIESISTIRIVAEVIVTIFLLFFIIRISL